MIRIGLTGAQGQLGLCIQDAATTIKNISIIPLSRDILDLNAPLTVPNITVLLRDLKCDLLVNTAAFTSVDGAEKDIASAYTINEKSPGVLSAACAELDIPIIHISTDYVFDGTKNHPYVEHDTPRPLSIYGNSKRDGEIIVLKNNPKAMIIRSAWLFSAYRKNFMKTILSLAEKKSDLSIVSDQIGNPTYTPDLAHAVLVAASAFIKNPKLAGIYHYAGTPETSWHGFATEIFNYAKQHGIKTPTTLVPIPTSGYPLPAKRPNYSALSSEFFIKTFNISPSDWAAGINDALIKLQKNGDT